MYYLNTCSLSQNVIKDKAPKYRNTDISLRENLSNYINSTPNIFFRNNATQCLKDILVSVNNDFQNCRVFFSKNEHPVIKQIVSIYSTNYIEIQNKKDFISDIVESSNSCTGNYIPVILISHVIWFSGEILDIKHLSATLKDNFPQCLIIIDGAQSVGNISITNLSLKDSINIDIYIGCGQKWLNNHFPIGFFWINSIVMSRFSFFAISNILINDIFSQYAGELSVLEPYFKDTYNKQGAEIFNYNISINSLTLQQNRNIAFNTYFQEIFETSQYNMLRKNDFKSGIFSIFGTKDDIEKLYNTLIKKDIICSTFRFNEMEIIRFGTPVNSIKKVARKVKQLLKYD